jgi:hypothetical protein
MPYYQRIKRTAFFIRWYYIATASNQDTYNNHLVRGLVLGHRQTQQIAVLLASRDAHLMWLAALAAGIRLNVMGLLPPPDD